MVLMFCAFRDRHGWLVSSPGDGRWSCNSNCRSYNEVVVVEGGP